MRVSPATRVVRAVVAVALTAAGLAVATGTAPVGAAVPCQRTFVNSTPVHVKEFGPMPIPPFSNAPGLGSSAIDVPAGTVTDVNITVHVTHPNAEQLALSVTHNAVGATLKDAGGPAGADFAGTAFDDEASQAITSGAPPYSGSFRPLQALSAYDGAAAGGSWTLLVTNNAVVAGTIDWWSVSITFAGSCDNDADGVEDHADQCLDLAGHTASGCPLVGRAVSAKYRHGKFKGALSSSVPSCRASRAVTVWKVRKGPDLRIGSRTTAADGTYKLKRAKHAGRYYATSPQVVLAGTAECPAVQSATFRLR